MHGIKIARKEADKFMLPCTYMLNNLYNLGSQKVMIKCIHAAIFFAMVDYV